MSRIPVITGLGLVTPLGSSVDETWRELLAGRVVINHARCPLDNASPHRVHHLAVAAAREAVADARWEGIRESRAVPGAGIPARGRAGSSETFCGRTALVVG